MLVLFLIKGRQEANFDGCQCLGRMRRSDPMCLMHVRRRRGGGREGVTEGGGEARLKPSLPGSGISHYRSPWTPQTVVRARGSKSHKDCSRCGRDLTLALTRSFLRSLFSSSTCRAPVFANTAFCSSALVKRNILNPKTYSKYKYKGSAIGCVVTERV